MGMGWRAFFPALHIVSLVGIGVLFHENGIVDPALYDQASRGNAADALQFALQVGRLDIVSLMLAIYAVFAGVATIFGFVEIRQRATAAARSSAEDEAKKLIHDFLDNQAPSLIREHVEFLSGPSNGDGDAVATADLARKD